MLGRSRDAVERCLEAIRTRDGALRSVIELNPEALAIADALDREKSPRSPLHGLPVLIKDNIDTADKMKTTAGRSRCSTLQLPKRMRRWSPGSEARAPSYSAKRI